MGKVKVEGEKKVGGSRFEDGGRRLEARDGLRLRLRLRLRGEEGGRLEARRQVKVEGNRLEAVGEG